MDQSSLNDFEVVNCVLWVRLVVAKDPHNEELSCNLNDNCSSLRLDADAAVERSNCRSLRSFLRKKTSYGHCFSETNILEGKRKWVKVIKYVI